LIERKKSVTDRFELLDCLRGLAAMSVVLYHYVGFIPLMRIPVGSIGQAIVSVTRYGYLGVPTFFVLSGYVIAMTAARYEFAPQTSLRFVLRRLVRLVPPYWLMVAIYVATILLGKRLGAFANTEVTAGQVAAHFGYAQHVLGFPPLDIAYWTLCLEVQFYFVFALTAFVGQRLSSGVLLAILTLTTAGSIVLNLAAVAPEGWFPGLWYQFGLGTLVFHAGRRRGSWPALAIVLLLVAAKIWHLPDFADVVVVAVSGLLLSVRTLRSQKLRGLGMLTQLGTISYSLYLVHGYVGFGLGILFRSRREWSETTAWLLIVTATIVALASASLFYLLCERRCIEWSRRVRIGPAPPADPAKIDRAPADLTVPTN
jgi:peptidoglycan/LPS O-acetylase OafA/YrhL